MYNLITSTFCWHCYYKEKYSNLIKVAAFTAAIKLCQVDHARREIIDMFQGERGEKTNNTLCLSFLEALWLCECVRSFPIPGSVCKV